MTPSPLLDNKYTLMLPVSSLSCARGAFPLYWSCRHRPPTPLAYMSRHHLDFNSYILAMSACSETNRAPCSRYQASLSLPRLQCHSCGHWTVDLWPFSRFSKGQHKL